MAPESIRSRVPEGLAFNALTVASPDRSLGEMLDHILGGNDERLTSASAWPDRANKSPETIIELAALPFQKLLTAAKGLLKQGRHMCVFWR